LVGFEREKKVIDLTTKKVVVSTLEEAVIQCLNEEKVCPLEDPHGSERSC
jgi:hypothetical protein